MRNLHEALTAVQAWVERHEYKGYDPGDGLTSFVRPLACGTLLGERLLQQAIWKSPVNLRPLVGVRPLESTKGRGFMAWGHLLRYAETGDTGHVARAVACLDWLRLAAEPGHAGLCWGNHFDFTTRSGRMPAHTPTIVWTSLIGHAFLEAYEQLGYAQFLAAAESICDWILALPREQTAAGACLSYTALQQNSVHNSNLLGAGVLARTWRHNPKPEYRRVAEQAVRYSCARQLASGAWFYGEHPKYHWIDSFHTGYNLDSLRWYIRSTGDEQYRASLERGYAYFRVTFFEASARPRYYHDRTFPIDIQCAAQAIDTLCHFVNEDPGALAQAQRVARWTIHHMQHPDGHFYYRIYPGFTAKTPYFHWGQATMFKALAHLSLVQSGRPERPAAAAPGQSKPAGAGRPLARTSTLGGPASRP